MTPDNVTIALAFLAGLASFLSPCVLALVPAYIGYLSSRSVSADGLVAENRWQTFGHGVAFVLGFSVVFVALGAAASLIGSMLYDARTWLARIGGVVVVIFGLHTLGAIHIPLLDFDTRRQMNARPGLGYGSSVLMGVFFSAGWAPCVGPVLGVVLTLALTTATLNQGVILLVAYSAGLAIPFLLAALGVGRVAELMRRHPNTVQVVARVTGVAMIIVGIMLFTGTLETLARYGFFIDLGL